MIYRSRHIHNVSKQISKIVNLLLLNLLAISVMVAQPSESFINLQDFITSDNDRANVVPAIARAITQCKIQKKGLFIPAGTYNVSPVMMNQKRIDPQKNHSAQALIDIENMKDFQVLASANTNFIIDPKEYKGRNRSLVFFSIRDSENIEVENIKLLPVASYKAVTEDIIGCVVRNSKVVTLDKFNFSGIGSGIRVVKSEEVQIRESKVTNCYDTGINFFNRNKNCVAVHCIIKGCGDGNATIYAQNNNCGFRNCSFSGGRAKATYMAVIESSQHCFISGCTFDGTDEEFSISGAILQRSQYCKINNNIIKGLHYGVIVRQTDITDKGGVFNYGHIIDGNQIFNIYKKKQNRPPRGVWIEYSNGIKIVNNTFSKVAGTQIKVSDRGKKREQNAGRNLNLLVANNHFILKNTAQGKSERASFFSFDNFVFAWKEDYPLEGLIFKDNSIQRAFNSKRPSLKINDIKNSLITGNITNDPNNSTCPPLFLNIEKAYNTTISNNIIGNISILSALQCIIHDNKINNHRAGSKGIEIVENLEASMIHHNIVEAETGIALPPNMKNNQVDNNIIFGETAKLNPQLRKADTKNLIIKK